MKKIKLKKRAGWRNKGENSDVEPQLLADGASIRKMKIHAVNLLFASVNFLSQGRASPGPGRAICMFIKHITAERIKQHCACTWGPGWSGSEGAGWGARVHLPGSWGQACVLPTLPAPGAVGAS